MTEENETDAFEPPQDDWIDIAIAVTGEIAEEGNLSEAYAITGYLKGIRAGVIKNGCPELLPLAVKLCEHPDIGGAPIFLMEYGAAGLYSREPVYNPKGVKRDSYRSTVSKRDERLGRD